MPTYRQIQDYVRENSFFTVRTCWIAHVKELMGLEPRRAANRRPGDERANPCPILKRLSIVNAFEHFHIFPTNDSIFSND